MSSEHVNAHMSRSLSADTTWSTYGGIQTPQKPGETDALAQSLGEAHFELAAPDHLKLTPRRMRRGAISFRGLPQPEH
jgi:hypothetical protein